MTDNGEGTKTGHIDVLIEEHEADPGKARLAWAEIDVCRVGRRD